jgi:putative ABC transport system substrate-binding protein
VRVRRIGLAVVLAFCLLAAPLSAEAQQAGRIYRIGLIAAAQPVSEMAGPEPVSPSWGALAQGLRALGYMEGQNLILERRAAEGRYGRFGDIVAELVRLKADVIVTGSTQLAGAAKAVTARRFHGADVEEELSVRVRRARTVADSRR